MEQKDIKLCEELKEKAEEAADRIEELAGEVEDVESDREELSYAVEYIKDIAGGITAENWQDCASAIIEKCEEVL